MKEEVLEATGSRKVAGNMAASKIKAAAKAGEMNSRSGLVKNRERYVYHYPAVTQRQMI